MLKYLFKIFQHKKLIKRSTILHAETLLMGQLITYLGN